MDVELLRPGTAPISPETVLWFEFLLDPDLLLKHLQKPCPDPSPVELITKFYDVISETTKMRHEVDLVEIPSTEPNSEKSSHAKHVALKILSMKIAAFLKWNLESIQTLPFKTQISLLQDLLFFTNDKNTSEIPSVEVQDIHLIKPHSLFAFVLFHRWLLKTSMHKVSSNWPLRCGVNDVSPVDINFMCSPENIKKSVLFLTDAMNWEILPTILTFECFVLPTEANDFLQFQWDNCLSISKDEFCAQINFDLGTLFFYKEEYEQAKPYFSHCLECLTVTSKVNEFLDVDRQMLETYINACCGSPEISKRNLLEQLNLSIVNQYKGVTTILQHDNVYKEIPLIHRLTLELDIQGALSSGAFTVARDLLFKIKALNVVRSVLDKKPIYQCSFVSNKNVDMFLWAFQVSWKSFSQIDKQLLKAYLLELILKGDFPDLLTCIESAKDFDILEKLDIQYIHNYQYKYSIPERLSKTSLNMIEFSKKRKPRMELRQLEQELIDTYNFKEIKELLVKIAVINLGTSVWNINPQWELPIPLQSVLKSLPRGFHQDYAYIMLAKSKEQLLNKNWSLSIELLQILEEELRISNCNIPKLMKLISWEILLVQITQLIDEWPKHTVDKYALANACEACLQTNDIVLPRTEIVEQCAVYLLNLGRWDFLINYEKRRPTFEITSSIASSCQEMAKQKGNKKVSKTLWDIVLPIFATNQLKRNNSGHHDISSLKNNLISIFFKLKDSWCLAVVISLLAKLFNILKDESSLDLQVDCTNLWPAVVSNANSYNPATVCELLSEIVIQALKHYPTNVSWLRLMGDINFASGHYRTSLSYYLKSLMIFNDYFNIPVRNEDHIFRRMVKCCTNLGCYTQAAVLCQFLEETDYLLAFRILADQKTSSDAVDAYYHCFWDTSILEYLIHTHNKKGEFQRRKCAVQVIGSLELNSNNNDEIQKEASNLRKGTFLRALSKQFVFVNSE
ncbi:hypothetical protein NQ315_007978 [Exocentrus adspersus]|uniref:INTS8 TPR repeats domain-containing protein n=1 Tax=Exocentrus adspersus TaxID=1586481 RepID=A0AAV8VG10_9CUCU|nr:hypothetical protein NQ315_007978 [Exocentrus adspersus]